METQQVTASKRQSRIQGSLQGPQISSHCATCSERKSPFWSYRITALTPVFRTSRISPRADRRDLLPADAPPVCSHRLVTRTLLADADIEDTGARAVSWWHAEASVVWVDRRVGKHHRRGHEAVGWDARHSSRAVVHQEQRPARRRSQTQGC